MKVFFFQVFVLLKVFSLQAMTVSETPPEWQSPVEIVSILLQSLKENLPGGYDQRFKVVQKNGYERVFFVENENCYYDGWLVFDVRRNHSSSYSKDVLSYTCNATRDTIILTRAGENLEKIPAESLVTFELSVLQDTERFVLEIMPLGITLDYQRQAEEDYTLHVKINSGLGGEQLVEMSKKKEGDITYWVTRAWADLSFDMMSVGPLKPKMTVFKTEARKAFPNEDLYFYSSFIDGKSTERHQYLNQYEKVSKLVNPASALDDFLNMDMSFFESFDGIPIME